MDRIGNATVTAPVTVNEIAHAWEGVREAQRTAVTGNLKLIQATFSFGQSCLRAESQMGGETLMAELEERGIEAHTAREAMALAKANPGGVADIAADPKKIEKWLQKLLLPSAEVERETDDKGRPAFSVTFRLNVDPAEMKPDTLGELRRKIEPALRLAFQMGWAREA